MPNTGVMASLPKPLIALLVATVAAFALWTAVLKKTVTGDNTGSSQSAPALQSAVDKAHQAVTTANAASAAHGGTVSSPPPSTANAASAAKAATGPKATTAPKAATTAKPATTATPATTAKTGATHKATTQKAVAALTALAKTHPGSVPSIKSVVAAISAHKVVALLFFNPSAADDVAVKAELASLSTRGRRVAKFAVPLKNLADFQTVTSRVPVTTSPTLLLIDKQGQTSTLTGFVDQLAISQRVADALSAK